MGGEDSKLLRRLYAEALQRDPEERAEYLDAACPDRPDLRARVLDLLAADAGRFLEPEGRTTFAGQQPGTGGSNPGEWRIGPYIIRREIGRGGMGIVYLADDTRLQRRVALKALNPNLKERPDLRDRLRSEARVAAGLTHPGIATVYALDEIDDELYLSCEFVPGTTLRALLKTEPMSIDEVVSIGLQLARALAEAHTKGIVHRDLKPENVIRTPSGVVKILDFGLARDEQAAQASLTQTGFIVGTPAYMSPEQALGLPTDFRTDLFALGLLLYELASGVNPFADTSLTGTLAKIKEEDPPPLSTIQPRSGPALDRIIATCLRKDPQKRYASTGALIAEIERVRADASSTVAPPLAQPAPVPGMSSAQAMRWLAVHQPVVSFVYIATLYPAWYAKGWLPEPWGLRFVLVLLATAAAAASLRLHLWFTAAHLPSSFAEQHARSSIGARGCDLLFALVLLGAAVIIGEGHPEFAMLFVAIAIALIVVSFVIEPSTAAAAGAVAPPAKLRRG